MFSIGAHPRFYAIVGRGFEMISLLNSQPFQLACMEESPDRYRDLVDRQPEPFRAWAEAQYARLGAVEPVASSLGHVLETGLVPDGLICEFGVCTGRSTNLMARTLAPREVFGFDSFEGLPDDWVVGDLTVPKGFLAVDVARLQFEPNVNLVKGFFKETLPGFLQEHTGPIGLMHIDCDTYESTVDILNLTADRLPPGSIIVFDEILGDMGLENEMKALWEFLESAPCDVEWINWGGHCWTAKTQGHFADIKRPDFSHKLKTILTNPGYVLRHIRNGKKIEECTSAAALQFH